MNTKAMKSYALLTVLLATLVIAQGQNKQDPETRNNRLSISQIRDYRKMTRVNKQPIDMVEETKLDCAAPSMVSGPHHNPGLVYYINDIARQAIATYSENKVFPVGSIIVKEKQERRTEDSVQIITVMKKVRSGNTGDSWEYRMYDTKKWEEVDVSKQPTTFGRRTCLECHTRYRNNDYVSNRGIELLLRK